MLDPTQKNALLVKLHGLDGAGNYTAIIDTLEALPEIDLELALELVRAYLNRHGSSRDDFDLNRAADILHTFEDEGAYDAQYLYLKAMVLIKENLLQDAVIRLERARRCVPLTRPELFSSIEQQLALIQKAAAVRALTAAENAAFDAHAAAHFGQLKAELKGDNLKIMLYAPNQEHPFYLAVTKGLSALRQRVPAGADERENSCLELALALPEAWPVDRGELKYYYPFSLLFDLAAQIRLSPNFVGFGYTMDNGEPLVSYARYSALMLTALGDYPKAAQSYTLEDGFKVNIFQVLPLYPLEVAFRRTHSAQELLERMRTANVVLCPYYEDRKDALAQVQMLRQ